MAGEGQPGRRCHCCQHPHRNEIDRALLSGESRETVGMRFGLGTMAVARHAKNHLERRLAVAMKKQAEVMEIDYSRDLLTQAHEIQGRVMGKLKEAEEAQDIAVLARVGQQGVALLASVIDRLGGTEDREVTFTWED